MMAFIYVVAALLVGWFGRKRVIGFSGWFLASLVITPPIASMILLFTQSSRES
ncbi:MAG TPA: hypothetical protein VK196_14385 [Magnetospirillum sp.]|nr:hypothetical protein [Magnetospirillum sp.]